MQGPVSPFVYNDTEFNKFATVGEFVERGAHNVEMINTSLIHQEQQGKSS